MNNSHTIDITYIEGYATQRKKKVKSLWECRKGRGNSLKLKILGPS